MIGSMLRDNINRLVAIYSWLTTYWTAARAAKLDFITAGVAVASTALSTATWTSARAAKLDFLTGAAAEAAEPLISPPIAAGFGSYSAGGVTGGFANESWQQTLADVHSSNATTTLADAVNITGSGVLNLVLHGATAQAGTIIITIDGVVVVNSYVTTAGKTVAAVGLIALVGADPVLSFDQIPFRTSLRIQHKTNAAGGTSTVGWKYRRTA